MHTTTTGSVRQRTGTHGGPRPVPTHDVELDWSWPPYAPIEAAGTPFDTPDWAPPSVVWHPRFRVGRWTLVYARSA